MYIINEVVRVAVNNNFNCTDEEYDQLSEFTKEYPHKYFFTNSNIKTPLLLNINNYPFKTVLTLNPDIYVDESLIERFYEIDPEKIAFVRVKFIPNHEPFKNLLIELSKENYNIVVTIQRFNGNKTISKFVPDSRKQYIFDHNRFRLFGKTLKSLQKIVDNTPNTYICDRKGLGCQGCGLCSTLNIGRVETISSLNLSTSGDCTFNCVDCYAKTMQNFLKRIGVNHIVYDVIKKNAKQSGRTKHIKDAIKAA